MSRQPRKVFGFTGAAKYGPVADNPPGVPEKKKMKQAGEENKKSSNSLDCYYFWFDPKGFCCTFITCCGVCKNIDCSSI